MQRALVGKHALCALFPDRKEFAGGMTNPAHMTTPGSRSMKGLVRNTVLVAVCSTFVSACALFQPEKTGQAEGREYTVTVKNTLAKERFAPILIVGDADDRKIWVGNYVSNEAHTQFTTGNPGPLAAKLGGDQGQPGKLGVGEEITFKFRTTARKAR